MGPLDAVAIFAGVFGLVAAVLFCVFVRTIGAPYRNLGAWLAMTAALLVVGVLWAWRKGPFWPVAGSALVGAPVLAALWTLVTWIGDWRAEVRRYQRDHDPRPPEPF